MYSMSPEDVLALENNRVRGFGGEMWGLPFGWNAQ